MTIDHLVGRRVTLRGIAGDAAGGAVLLVSEGTPVYVEGMSGWDALAGSTIEITGELERAEIAPLLPAQGELASHGAPGRQYVLRNPTQPRPQPGG
ncbi:hypothetical protein [Couchioplanes caeruleus]|uniref:Uncharacterized protein n=2 Tax=Couchioplanes caeruleus TaxID=56438 RepID=A0A1K0GEI5_9ACTN|nr:hypothetical protein [Couchioplanes caeruleus]OJF10558.1 hypothetical protein BG844_31595 [Couchioplanes caeruleus subsp. caeruleus]ROP28653.1 hypothetical protein EDD30_1422 [Couchioplanes caeruleus]